MGVLIAVVVILATTGFAYAYRHDISASIAKAIRGPIPAAVDRRQFVDRTTPMPATNPDVPLAPAPTTVTPTPTPTPKPAPKPVPEPTSASSFPATFNLKVPFIVQAPYAVWDEIHEDGCEEASISMIKGYVENAASFTAAQMEDRILAVVDYENNTLGYNKDTSAEQTAGIMRDFFGYKNAQVLPVRSWKDIKAQLVKGQPVVVPAYGKALNNPYFRDGGPVYHMLVIKGWTATKIITNDPGTKRGADLLYDPDTLMKALHDWNGGDVPGGAKVMIVANE